MEDQIPYLTINKVDIKSKGSTVVVSHRTIHHGKTMDSIALAQSQVFFI